MAGKDEGKRTLERARPKWKDILKCKMMWLRTGTNGLLLSTRSWNFRVSQNENQYLTSCVTVSFWRRFMLQGLTARKICTASHEESITKTFVILFCMCIMWFVTLSMFRRISYDKTPQYNPVTLSTTVTFWERKSGMLRSHARKGKQIFLHPKRSRSTPEPTQPARYIDIKSSF
jgi:hypothetical protein